MPRALLTCATLFLSLPLASARDGEAGGFTVESVHATTPSTKQPLTVEKEDRKTRGHWKDMVKWYHSLPADQVTAHPHATDFPGPVAKTAGHTEAMVEFRLDQPRWHGTGLYAAPGELLSIRVPEPLRGKGLRLRIGCHKDNIMPWQTKWRRFPVISRSFALDQEKVQAANPFGGLVYIEVPQAEDAGGWKVPTFGGSTRLAATPATPAPATLEISGAVRSPWFRLGTTTPDQWRQQLAKTGAPWGEIAGRHLVLSLPIDVLRTVKDLSKLKPWMPDKGFAERYRG